ncbi:MAG: methylated-DNA--[protein]-cysteine S-methyltransferase [Candidatus Competibacteraceae bacterium]|jgi:methylated-DNA-[protein]-cysteine S-methyltransferase|nr:methylated-DNA--[protein]-cysteine S-methyltransferase [Candidatus Competibacteraceae bacterium]
MTFYHSIECPLGTLILTTDGEALTGVYFEGQRHFVGIQPDWQKTENNPILNAVSQQLDEYFSKQRAVFYVPLSAQGTEFQQAVWRALQAVNFGERLSYSGLAEKVGRPNAVRAVAAAVGRNPISVVIPCHRIIGKNNSLTGYAGGLARKAALLELEVAERQI